MTSQGFAAGVLAGLVLFFLCYWWLGTISLSAIIGLIVVGLVALAFRHKV